MSDAASARHTAAWLRQRQAAALPHVRMAALAGTLGGLATIVQLGVMAWIARQVLVADTSVSGLGYALTIGVVAILVRGWMHQQQMRSSAKASDQIRAQLRSDLLRHWGNQGPVITASTSSGTLASEWLDHVDALHGYYARFQPQLILCVTIPLMILAVVFWLDWLAAVFLLLSAPLIPLFMALVGMGAEKLNQQHMETLGRLSGHFLDQIRGLTTLQLFGATNAATRTIGQVTDDYRRINMKTLRVAFLSSAVLEFFASVAIAVVAIYIGFGLLGYIDYGPSPDLTLFSGLFILLLAPEFFQPLRTLAQHYHDRATALGAAAKLQERLDQGAQPAAPFSGPDCPGVSTERGANEKRQPAVTINNLGLSLSEAGQPLFSQFDLTVAKGTFVAVTGPSGSGKSTLLGLITGFRQPDTGEIKVFGGPAGAQPSGWLGQRPFIHHGTWAANLRLAAPDATDRDLDEALRLVGLAGLVHSRPQGLNTAIGEGGVGLSGGQARRLALARIFLARFPLVLLDEPTAGLDQHSEALIIEALKQLQASGATLITATHHSALIKAADQVINLGPDSVTGRPPQQGDSARE